MEADGSHGYLWPCYVSCLLVAMCCQATPQHMTPNRTFSYGKYSSESDPQLSHPVRPKLCRPFIVTLKTDFSMFMLY